MKSSDTNSPDGKSHVDRIRRLRTFAWLLDEVIVLPGGFRIGLDPIIGLVPGLGDAIGGIFAAYIVIEAANLGAPRSIVARMLGNVLLDTLVGCIPVAGDLFDFAFKANTRNIDLLERYHFDPVNTHRSSRVFLIMAASISLLTVLAVVALVALGVVAIAKLF